MWPRPMPDPTKRWSTYEVWCQNPACSHARRPHPITGTVCYGSRYEPPETAPNECPLCGADLDTEPLFENDEPYVSQEWE